MATIEEISQTVAGVASNVAAGVVGVAGRRAAGSGVIVGKDRVLTNAHNLSGDEVTVTFADGRTAAGKPVGVDVEGDVAVLEVDTKDAPALEWNGSSQPGIGAPVFAVANPGGRGLRVTFGLVSGTERAFRGPRGRRIAGSIEHTAPLLPGSSGGPIVDAHGHLVGINTHRLSEGFYLAIPADDSLKQRVDALGKGESPKRVRLGVALIPSHIAKRLRSSVGLPEVEGLLVRGVEDDSPAAKAGLQQGDLLTHAGGRGLRTIDDLFSALDGSDLTLQVLRGTEDVTVEVKFSGARHAGA